MKAFFVSLVLILIYILLAIMRNDLNIFIEATGITGIIFIILAGIVTGVFQRRDIFAENYTHEDKWLRNLKSRWSINLFIIGILNFFCSYCFILYFCLI